MPRVENSGPEVEGWIVAPKERPTKHDLCVDCSLELQHDPEFAQDRLQPLGPNEPMGEWEGTDGPSYDADLYYCRVCGKMLVEMIDGADC